MAPQNDTILEKVITTIRELNSKYNLGIEIPDTTSTGSLVSSRAQCDAKFARSLAILKYAIHHYYRNVFVLDKILRSFLWEALAISEDWIHPCHPHDMIAATTTPPKAHSPGELLRLQLTLINVLKRAAETTGDTSSAVDDEVGFSQSANPFQPASAGATVSHPSTTTCVLIPESTCTATCVPPPDTAQYTPVDSPAKEIPIPGAQRTVPEQEHTPPSSSHSHSCDISSGELGVGVRLGDHGHPPGNVSGIDDPSLYEPILGPPQTPAPVVDLQSRLDATWPILPSWLTRAPFAVAWEVTRIALHCGVVLDNLAMSCDETWSDYDIMCRALREHPSFATKVFPGRPAPDAWAAVAGFLCERFGAKDGSDFAAACSPFPWPRHVSGEPRQKLEVREMLDWLLQLDRNEDQLYLKLFARIQLGLSKTTAVAVLDQDQIRHMQKDVVSPIGQVMNDGVGRMSLSLARKVRDVLELSDVPSAIQGRLGSAKGMWIIDVEDTGSDIWIETWPSQRKWNCDFLHQEHRTLEIKDFVAEPRSANLNIQFLPILEDRAKDKQIMRKVVGDNVLRQLSDELEALRNAIKHPLQFRKWVDENSTARKKRLAHSSVPFLAGLPESKEEQLSYLGDGGFEPTKQKFMQDMMWKLQSKKCENVTKKMSIRIPNSAYLYMVVDFWGILEENEVHVCFSSTFRTEGFSDSMLHGCDVLVARSPAHLVSDIQRVKAVFKPELRALKNVIVFPAKGDVALADKLSGGDYDGGRAWVCWEPAIVSNFENANVPTRPDLSGFLRKDEASFGDLTRQVGKSSAASTMITRT
ncbi:hypothetical protein CGMCC3_g17952 [Colletotrichum fructicola]|nr:uncharacterized protein CGMCC3_g17952 [Colletotrichum fructicola]KAE9565876.1 hypothetical protein CGMCC3_g17952 [Colletotrichum fructicola]